MNKMNNWLMESCNKEDFGNFVIYDCRIEIKLNNRRILKRKTTYRLHEQIPKLKNRSTLFSYIYGTMKLNIWWLNNKIDYCILKYKNYTWSNGISRNGNKTPINLYPLNDGWMITGEFTHTAGYKKLSKNIHYEITISEEQLVPDEITLQPIHKEKALGPLDKFLVGINK